MAMREGPGRYFCVLIKSVADKDFNMVEVTRRQRCHKANEMTTGQIYQWHLLVDQTFQHG